MQSYGLTPTASPLKFQGAVPDKNEKGNHYARPHFVVGVGFFID